MFYLVGALLFEKPFQIISALLICYVLRTTEDMNKWWNQPSRGPGKGIARVGLGERS